MQVLKAILCVSQADFSITVYSKSNFQNYYIGVHYKTYMNVCNGYCTHNSRN